MTVIPQVSLFQSIAPLFKNKPFLVVCNKTDVLTLEDLTEDKQVRCDDDVVMEDVMTMAVMEDMMMMVVMEDVVMMMVVMEDSDDDGGDVVMTVVVMEDVVMTVAVVEDVCVCARMRVCASLCMRACVCACMLHALNFDNMYL